MSKLTPEEEAKLLEQRFYKEIPSRVMHFDNHKKLALELAIRTCELMMGENESMKQLMVVHGNERAMFAIGERIAHLEKVWGILDKQLQQIALKKSA